MTKILMRMPHETHPFIVKFIMTDIWLAMCSFFLFVRVNENLESRTDTPLVTLFVGIIIEGNVR